MNTPVNFTTAKLLKEKGFVFTQNETYYNPVNGVTKYEEITPTISEVVMWLYEKHGIWIECLHRGDMGDFTFKVSKLENGWKTEPHYIHESGFNSPTEAYEAAIEYTLTNIK